MINDPGEGPLLSDAEISLLREAGKAWGNGSSPNGDASLNVSPDLDRLEERGRAGSRYMRVRRPWGESVCSENNTDVLHQGFEHAPTAMSPDF